MCIRDRVYTYHYDEGSSSEEEPSTDKTDVSLDDAGNATWGEEEVQEDAIEENSEEITAETDSLAPKVYIITADTTKKTFSSYAKGNKEGEWKTWYPNGMLEINMEHKYQLVFTSTIFKLENLSKLKR